MSLKLDLLLEAINEITLEESAGKNGLIERAAYEKYKAEKKKNDDYDKITEKKRQMYERAGYEDRAPEKVDRHSEKDALETYKYAKKSRNVASRYSSRGNIANECQAYGTDTAFDIRNKIVSTNKRNSEKESSVNKRINKKAERAKAMGESVEDHIAFADTLLELLD